MSEIGDWHWRNTMRPVRFFAFDSRAVIGILMVIMHVRTWTFMLALIGISCFFVAERAGYDFDSSLRRIRSYIVGPKRPASMGLSRRRLKDYGN